MKKPVYFLVIIVLFFSCNRNSKTPKKEKSTIDLTQTDKEEKIVESKEELILSPPTNCNETFDDFEVFFERFSKDSVFQKNRVKYPLKHIYYKDLIDDDVTIDFITDRKSYYYKYTDFTKDKDAVNNEYGKFEVYFQKKDSTFLYKRSGIDNDIRVIFSFEILNSCWFLVSIEN